jgi:hypothetical protein
MKLYPQAAILLLPFKFGSSDAAIFENNKRWPVDEKSSFTIIPVCITDDSSAYNNDSSIPPSLNAVVGRMRWALSQGWEQYSTIRFVGLNKCSEQSEPENTVSVSIKVGNENNSTIGTDAKAKRINLKPWGYDCYGFSIAMIVLNSMQYTNSDIPSDFFMSGCIPQLLRLVQIVKKERNP